MSRTIRLLFAAGLLGTPTPARAQTPSSAECGAFLGHVKGLQLAAPPAATVGVGPDTCRYDGVEVKTDGRGGYQADSVLVRGIGFDPAASAGAAMTMRAEARGVVRTFHIGQPAVEYMLSQQQSMLTVVFDVTYDPAAKTWVIHELSLDGERLGHVSVDGELDGVPPIHDSSQPSPGGEFVSVRRVHGHLDSRVFVSQFVLPALIDRLPQAKTADLEEVAVRAELAVLAATARELLTASGASPATAQAVGAVIEDFPHPRHPFDVTIEAADPLSFHEIETAPDRPDGLASLTRRVMVEATYAGAFRP